MYTPLGRTNHLLYSKKQQHLDRTKISRPRGTVQKAHHTIPRVIKCFYTNFQLFISKIEDFAAQGCIWGYLGPLGAVHRGLQTPLAMGLSHHTLIRVFMCFHTNFQLVISKIEDFVAQGQFWACLGPLGAVHRGPQTPLAIGLPHHTTLRVSRCFYTNFQLFISKFVDFMAQGWFWGCQGPLGAVLERLPAQIFGRLYYMS